MTTIDLSQSELADIIQALGGPFRTQPFTANDRLALRMRLEALVTEERKNAMFDEEKWEKERRERLERREPEREGNAPLASHPIYGEK